MASRLIWNGDEILERVNSAVESAMNATLADAVAQAQKPGWTPRDSGTLAASIDFESVVRDGNSFVGSFGSYTIDYAIYVEVGTWKMEGRHYLRRASDEIFPTLPGRVAEFYR